MLVAEGYEINLPTPEGSNKFKIQNPAFKIL